MTNPQAEISLLPPTHINEGLWSKVFLGIFGSGALFFLLAFFKISLHSSATQFLLSFGLMAIGALGFFGLRFGLGPAGIRNNGVVNSSVTARGLAGWVLLMMMTGFYILLYWFPQYLHGLIALSEPFSLLIRDKKVVFAQENGSYSYDQWFLYGWVYTFGVLLMGTRAILKYRHNRYQIIRTLSVMLFQLIFAFILPFIFEAFSSSGNQYYISYFWPLDYDAIWPSSISALAKGGVAEKFVLFWGIFLTLIGTPIFTYFFGKRWYCSFVCGCGGLAETVGDPFRQNSDKSMTAWKIERISIYSVLVFVFLTTLVLWINAWTNGAIFGSLSVSLNKTYGFLIGMVFAGVIGTGFYPIFGSRVWCRFGCPMAATLGIIQKYYSRFRITVNGGQCISCGNCSKYCEMGIDVKAYAQKGQNIVRASCVGCGICSAVCPRGVLKLENGPLEGRNNTVGPLSFPKIKED